MKKGLTEIVTIIDKSGSMTSLRGKTIEGFNEFLHEQKNLDGEANFSLILFSSPYKEEIVFDSVDIKEVSELTEENYYTNGTTALYDCIGKTIKSLKKRIKNLDKKDRPERTLFVIITDGEENSSRIYDKEKIFKMINKKEKNGWNFIYLGANQDSFVEGSKMGLKQGKTLNYDATSDGINYAFYNISKYAKNYRTASTLDVANEIKFDDLKKED